MSFADLPRDPAMWKSRNKTDLIIEVWEKLDCESVGAVEIEAIETVVAEAFGSAAVDSPMMIARLLADEGAELRHSEVMGLYVARASDRPYDSMFLNLLDTADLTTTLGSIRQMENLRRRLGGEDDREGLRRLRSLAIEEKEKQISVSEKPGVDGGRRIRAREIAEWLTLWLQSPELFDSWVALRQRSEDYISKFGDLER